MNDYDISDIFDVTSPHYSGAVNLPTPPGAVNTFTDQTSPSAVGAGETIGNMTMADGLYKSANFVTGVSGWQLTPKGNLEANDGNFRGDITGASGTFSGTVTVGSINIGGDDATSAHIDTDGNLWLGASVANKATAPFRVSNAGVVVATNITATGTINATGGYLGAPTTVLNVSTSGLDIGVTGHIQGGASDYLTGTGFFLGYSGAAYKFSVGNPAGNYIGWDGTTLTIIGNQVDVQTFNANGTWTKPTGAKSVTVQAWGGGGGGGTATPTTTNSAAGGGGGGAYNTFTFNATALTATVAVTVPAAAAAAAAGGTVTFGAYVSSFGGGGGASSADGVISAGAGGGGVTSVGSAGSSTVGGAGGQLVGSAGGSDPGGAGVANGGFGGAGGGGRVGGSGGAAVYGGAGGGGGNKGSGGAAMYGAGGGGGGSANGGVNNGNSSGGVSKFGGNGADGGFETAGTAGTAPGGGGSGGGGFSTTVKTGGAGAVGRIVVTSYL